MSRYVRFAFALALAAGPALALDPPPRQNKQQQQKAEDKKHAEPVKPAAKSGLEEHESDARIDRRNARMKEREREIDRMLNKPKK